MRGRSVHLSKQDDFLEPHLKIGSFSSNVTQSREGVLERPKRLQTRHAQGPVVV